LALRPNTNIYQHLVCVHVMSPFIHMKDN